MYDRTAKLAWASAAPLSPVGSSTGAATTRLRQGSSDVKHIASIALGVSHKIEINPCCQEHEVANWRAQFKLIAACDENETNESSTLRRERRGRKGW